jgi:hypothetical protein
LRLANLATASENDRVGEYFQQLASPAMPQPVRLDYQRTIIGYHGCDQDLALRIRSEGVHLTPSKNDFDWLGTGVYFWEHAPRRALQFAHEQKARAKLDTPAVLGAYINLGRCFDLTDTEHTQQLQPAYQGMTQLLAAVHAEVPENKRASGRDNDLLLRYRDCAVINWYMSELDKESPNAYHYQTIRGVFQEGPEAFDGSMIREKSHIQIAVRDLSCIVGFFLPTMFFRDGVDHG